MQGAVPSIDDTCMRNPVPWDSPQTSTPLCIAVVAKPRGRLPPQVVWSSHPASFWCKDMAKRKRTVCCSKCRFLCIGFLGNSHSCLHCAVPFCFPSHGRSLQAAVSCLYRVFSVLCLQIVISWACSYAFKKRIQKDKTAGCVDQQACGWAEESRNVSPKGWLVKQTC